MKNWPLPCRRVWRLVLCCIASSALLAFGVVQAQDIDAGFRDPPPAARPWVYWWWLTGNSTPEAIRRDLTQMKEKGIGGFLLFDARGYHEYHTPPPSPANNFLDENWRKLFRLVLQEANRLGLRVSVNISSSAGGLSAPWPIGVMTPKELVWVVAPARMGTKEHTMPEAYWGPHWPVACLAIKQEEMGVVTHVVDLTEMVSDNRVTWEVTDKGWSIIWFACRTIDGRQNDVDILDPDAVSEYFHQVAGQLIKEAGPLAGKTLTHLYNVSWEGAEPTWTLRFEEFFRQQCGYDIRPYLPVLAGYTVKSREISDRFLYDYRKTLSECFRRHCYGTLQRLASEHGLKWHSESGGPWPRKSPVFAAADQLAFLGINDMPQGEFWVRGRMFCRPVAMAAHIYGRQLAAAEAFTHMQPHWSVEPQQLKPLADAAFCDGINLLVWHTFTHSPPEFGLPGIEYFAGTHFNPNVTWFEHAKPIVDYLARSQYLLQQGQFVADICCYVGDSPYLHWGRGESWSSQATLTPPMGYWYDLLSTEVLTDKLSVENGKLCLPNGMQYELLVLDLDGEFVRPEVLRKVWQLVQAGAKVLVGKRMPIRAPGLTNYPACDEQVRHLAEKLWLSGGSDVARIGNGVVFRNISPAEALKRLGIKPDVEAPWPWVHRRIGDIDLYFVAGSGSAECIFRVEGRQPELWNPLTGRIANAHCFRTTDDNRTAVLLQLGENGSLFVVFRRPARRPMFTRPLPEGVEAHLEGDNTVTVTFWKSGAFVLPVGLRSVAVKVGPLPEQRTLGGPWQVEFPPGWGAPKSVIFPKLIPWNEHPQEGIKYFSGRATYRTRFELSSAESNLLVRLELGQVHSTARIRVNGQAVATLWTPPWVVDITGFVQEGENELEIEVANLWANRLIGDCKLPEEKGFTRTNVRRPPGLDGRWAHLRGYTANDPLKPSGLLGPVRLRFGISFNMVLPKENQ